ncbi:hypothetical protein QBC34DRAFT_376408 [Podospora aff. communis PSN243]|uniref:BTB domain-containing protein n=1 Tax=Podospora aff. communis PSN243 TaxID=3040156 RepID=A0AAV9H207_9PEZI|nr:hypothetical protein QBC34DRAFT_376408 [Podospora aff. communis PSN243]
MAKRKAAEALDVDNFVFASPSDTLITLTNPNAPFAVRDSEGSEGSRDPFKTPHQALTFQVSSQHLINASPFFKAALTGGWAESSTVNGSGHREIAAQDWDVKAFRIVMDIVHGRTKLLPRAVSVELLCKIAVVVDYYQLRDAAHFFLRSWAGLLDYYKDVATSRNGVRRNLVMWIFIAHMVENRQLFKQVTRSAGELSEGRLLSLGLPIPEWIIDGIEEQRERALYRVAEELGYIKQDLMDGHYTCDSHCRTMTVGLLAQHLYAHSLEPDVSLGAPYHGHSPDSVMSSALALEQSGSCYLGAGRPGSCEVSLFRILCDGLAPCLPEIQGLELSQPLDCE